MESPVDAPIPERCIAVQLGGAQYAFSTDDVQEVISMRPLTQVFHAPPAIAGVCSLRGDVLPVLDLQVLLSGQATELAGSEIRIVVLRDEKTGRRAGVVVDQLSGLRVVPSGGLAPLPAGVASGPARDLVAGVISDSPLCSVLRAASLLDSPALASLALAPESRDG